MKLTVKEIHKSQAIYKLLVELDEQIIKLDKKAMLLADHKQSVELCLTFEDDKKQKVVDEDGSLISFGLDGDYINRMMRGVYSPFSIGMGETAKKNTIDISLSDIEALNVLGFLISIKKQKRQVLINELKELGFEL